MLTLRDLIDARRPGWIAGRDGELRTLRELLGARGHVLVHIVGVAGIGKSVLLDTYCAREREDGTVIIRLDCRGIEPTDRGLLGEMRRSTGSHRATVDAISRRLATLGDRVLLVLDNYEVFRLLDPWLRQTFLPGLPRNVRVVLVGREPPDAAWLLDPVWSGGACATLPLGLLTESDALDLLESGGVSGEAARRIVRYTTGHPLALVLAARSLRERPDLSLDDAAAHAAVEHLARLYVADIPDAPTREALCAASLVRRITLPLLRALFPFAAPQDLYDRLHALPFVEAGRDGLVLHEAVRHPIAASLHSSDPDRCHDYLRAAWRCLQRDLGHAGTHDLWRFTADMLFLLQNPIVREAFFPSGGQSLTVAPVVSADHQAITAITGRHEGPAARAALQAWWDLHPEAFSAVRDREGRTVGFYAMLPAEAVTPGLRERDPVVRAWDAHLRESSLAEREVALYLRRWLSIDEGERPSPAQGACWLDIKRTYMELRPRLRRVYLTMQSLDPYADVAAELGFGALPEVAVRMDGVDFATAMLDFGPGSVDGWIARLVAAEIGIDPQQVLDEAARELVLPGGRVHLTPLEYGVIERLCREPGQPVRRDTLLADVWGYEFDGGSNVVDVVVRSLRRTMGAASTMIETERGIGYRYRPPGAARS